MFQIIPGSDAAPPAELIEAAASISPPEPKPSFLRTAKEKIVAGLNYLSDTAHRRWLTALAAWGIVHLGGPVIAPDLVDNAIEVVIVMAAAAWTPSKKREDEE